MTVQLRTATRLVAILLSVTPPLAQAARAADAANGERIATRWCVACHVVGGRQPRVTTEAAPFSEIAKNPDLNERGLAFFLLAPHPKMPDMSLTRAEAADLVAYIRSLRQ
jgi:mono/diheme cytochrome c family protein